MRRRYVLAGLAIVTAVSFALPAAGAPSAFTLARRALGIAKKADKTSRVANDRAKRAITDIRRSARSFDRRFTATNGNSIATARAGAPNVHLFSVGPFEVSAKCFRNTSGTPRTYVEGYVHTSAPGSIVSGSGLTLDGTPGYLEPTTAESARTLFSLNTADNAATSSVGTHSSAVAPNGSGFEAEISRFVKAGTPAAGNGPYGSGNVCIVRGDVIG
ncbi:MAG: hypothetical protein QOK31_830 [Solirubrobacteraceae bacterium]|jgi:hypothetical protein|nr:hypothetical protein [Solirubrobacteraceae bacterium]